MTEEKTERKKKSKPSVPIAKSDEESMRLLMKTFRTKYAPILRANKCQIFASHEEKRNKFIIPMLESLNGLESTGKKEQVEAESDSESSGDEEEDTKETKEKKEEKIELEPIFIQRKLHAGDFWIRLNGKLVFLIERKSIADLSGSIGARMRQQKFKCKRMPIPFSRVIYLTEGKKPARIFMKDSTTLMGALVDILVRDKMTVIHQPNDEATFCFLVKLLIKICEYVIGTNLETDSARKSHEIWTQELKKQPECPLNFDPLGAFDADTDYDPENPRGAYLTREELGFVESYCPDGWTEKPNKKLMNPKTWYMGALTGTRLIKAYKAEAILNEFPTLLDLVGFLLDPKTSEKQKIDRIANLTACKDTPVLKSKRKGAVTNKITGEKPKSKGKPRRLGEAIAKEIYHMILQRKYVKE